MEITVTQEHLDRALAARERGHAYGGTWNICAECLVAQALQDVDPGAMVGFATATVHHQKWDVDIVGRNLIDAFDDRQDITLPVTFTLTPSFG